MWASREKFPRCVTKEKIKVPQQYHSMCVKSKIIKYDIGNLLLTETTSRNWDGAGTLFFCDFFILFDYLK